MFGKSILTAAAIAAITITTASVGATSAFAGNHGHHGHGYHNGHGHHFKHRGHRNRGFHVRKFRNFHVSVQFGRQHTNWCSNRYKSYQAWNNSWLPYNNGHRKQCISPFYHG